MARRLIETITNDKGDMAKVYRDSVYGEFVVRFYMAGVGLVADADYYTNDKQDAVSTAKYTLNKGA